MICDSSHDGWLGQGTFSSSGGPTRRSRAPGPASHNNVINISFRATPSLKCNFTLSREKSVSHYEQGYHRLERAERGWQWLSSDDTDTPGIFVGSRSVQILSDSRYHKSLCHRTKICPLKGMSSRSFRVAWHRYRNYSGKKAVQNLHFFSWYVYVIVAN